MFLNYKGSCGTQPCIHNLLSMISAVTLVVRGNTVRGHQHPSPWARGALCSFLLRGTSTREPVLLGGVGG